MITKEVVSAAPTGYPRQFEVRNNFNDLIGEWEETYVNFSGYYGKHGPHVFAAAPDLLEALETLNLVIGLTPIAGNKQALQEACNIARAAIAKAKGAA